MNLDPQIFRYAAKDIVTGLETHCCCAISYNCYNCPSVTSISKAIKAFKDYFYEPHEALRTFSWWDLDDTESRILALLLMADIIESSP